MAVKVEGLDEVLRNLNNQMAGIKKRSLPGLKAAGLKVQREAQKRVPVDTGNLKGSASTDTISKDPPAVAISFNAAYAIFVHENLEANHPVGEAKFLENAVKDLRQEIVDTVAKFAKVK